MCKGLPDFKILHRASLLKRGLVFPASAGQFSAMNSARKTEIDKHLSEIEKRVAGFSPDSIQAPHITRIHVLIAEEQAESADKLERYTVALVRLTWAVVALTVVLVILTCWQLAHGK